MAKPSEPPPGIARLSGFLSFHGIPVTAADLNLEALLFLAGRRYEPSDTYSRRVLKNGSRNIESLRNPSGYLNPDGYGKAVRELSGLLERATAERFSVNLSDYTDTVLSPLRSADLLRSAENEEENPFHPFFSERLPKLLASSGAEIVGFSVNFLNQALCAFAMAGFLRKHAGGGLRIVMGGGLITSWVRSPGFTNPFSGLIDDLVDGPGEDFLLSAAGSPGGPHLAPVCREGQAFRTAGPLPDYSPFSLDAYLSPVRILPYAASYGCMWGRCRFCPERSEGNFYRPVSASIVSEELALLVPEYTPGLIHILDNEVSPTQLAAFVKNPPGVPWYGFARASYPLTDPGFCRALGSSGCMMLKLGVESGSQRVLDSMDKGILLSEVSRILGNLADAGIAVYVYLLFGTPQETEADAQATLDFTASHAGNIGFLNLAVFNLPAGSPDAAILATKAFYSGDLSLYREFSHPSGWNRDLVRRFLDGRFRAHPAVRPILRRTPPLFTSNHAPFFTRAAPGLRTP